MKKITNLVTSTERPEQTAKRKAITFGSFKRAEERQVAERKQREHEAELASIAEVAQIQKAVEDEQKRVIKEQQTEKRNKYVTETLSNAFKPKVKDMESVREQAIDTYLPKEIIPAAKDYPEPFKDEPALNKELADFKVKINEHLHKVGFASSGGGGIGSIADANDLVDGIDDGEFLQFRASDGKFIGATASVSTLALTALDIDGGTDIGAAIVDADLLVIDDGAGGTNRKTAASRIKTYVADVTLTTAAQTNITSVGTLTALQVDNLNINGNTISSTAGTDLLITPLSGQQIVLDGTIIVDAGVVTGATSITSTAFVGDITGDVTGNADTATALATARTIGGVSFNGSANINLPGVNSAGNQNTSGTAAIATTVTITDNESTNESNALIFAAGADVDGGNIGLESDGTLTYNPSTGKVTATGFVGALTGNASGTAATVTAAAQTNITSLGTLTTLTVDNIIINGTNIGHTSDTDAISISSGGVVTFTQSLEIGHASDTTLARSAAGVLQVEGDTIGLLSPANIWVGAQRATVTALSSSSNSIAISLLTSNDFSHTFTENTTLANPSDTLAPGQSGSIYLTQHASSPKTLAFGSEYDFVGGTVPTVTAANSARDRLDYVVQLDGKIQVTAVLNFS